MCEWGKQVTLPCPDWLYSEESGKRERGISVDSCIAEVIQHLWEQQVMTRGCCCGHFGKGPDGSHQGMGPNVIVDEHTDPISVLSAIREVDSRDWTVYRWELALKSYTGGTLKCISAKL